MTNSHVAAHLGHRPTDIRRYYERDRLEAAAAEVLIALLAEASGR